MTPHPTFADAKATFSRKGRRGFAARAADPGRAHLSRERRFAAALVAPAFMALLATTTFPLIYLAWTSTQRIDLAMPFLDGSVGLGNFRDLLADSRFWSSLAVSLIYTVATVVLQVAIGLGLALFVMEMGRGQAIFRAVAILPVVLSPAPPTAPPISRPASRDRPKARNPNRFRFAGLG